MLLQTQFFLFIFGAHIFRDFFIRHRAFFAVRFPYSGKRGSEVTDGGYLARDRIVGYPKYLHINLGEWWREASRQGGH
jgi:hypothetical protein